MKQNNKSNTAASAVSKKPSSRKSDVSANPSVNPVVSSVVPVVTDVHPGVTAVTANKVASSSPAATSLGKDIIGASKPHGKDIVASSKPHGKGIMISECPEKKIRGNVMFFRNLTLGPHESELRFRLINFWEARNLLSKSLFGVEMLLIDEEGTVVQGFIPAGKVDLYVPLLKVGTVYSLNKFFGSENKDMYRVSDHPVVVTFSWNSVIYVLENSPTIYPEYHFRFHSHEEFEAASDQRGDLYDCIGHMKVVNRQSLNDRPTLNEIDIGETGRILVHLQSYEGLVMKVYLWDGAATEFRQKFKSAERTPATLLVTTLNPKQYGGTLSLNTMSSSMVFMDQEVQPTREYLTCSNLDVANKTNGDLVTKLETLTIADLFSYIKQANAKVAWFECVATIDDVVRSSSWYYIACKGCKTKATKGPTSLMCKKCGKSDVIGTPQYLTKISVYDQGNHPVFVFLGDAGRDLTGQAASVFVDRFFEDNQGLDAEHVVPVPDGLLETIGQTRRFRVKVSAHNLQGKTMTLTVTKVLPDEIPPPMEEDAELLPAEVQPPMEEVEDGGIKRPSDGGDAEGNKRTKSG